MTRIDYEAVTPAGVTSATFDSLPLAKAYVRDNADRLPGLVVEEVTTTITRRPAYRPRLALVRTA